MKIQKQNIILVIILALLISVAAYIAIQVNLHQPIRVYVTTQIHSPDTYQVFYDTGKGFNEGESVSINVSPTENFQSLSFTLPDSVKSIDNLRFDPGYQTKDVLIKSISIKTPGQNVYWSAQEIPTHFLPVNMASKEVSSNVISFETSGTDPQLVYTQDNLNVTTTMSAKKLVVSSGLLIVFFLLCFLLIFFFRNTILSFLKSLPIINNQACRFSFIFIILLLIPLSQMIFRYLPETALQENRTLSPSPDVNLLAHVTSWDNYIHSFESFFNDHYGLRPILIKTNSFINIKLFHASPRTDVVIGKNGWLFFDTNVDGVSLEDFYGKALFTDDELSTIKNNLLRLKTRLAQQNIDLVVVLTSNKQSIYSEFLPTYIQQKKGVSTRADQLDKIAQEINLDYVDTRTPLEQAKKEYPYPLYYKTDTHWNDLGAFVAFKEIAKTIKARGYRINDFYKTSNLIVNSSVIKSCCDLAGMLNFVVYKDDTKTFLNQVGPYTLVTKRANENSQTDGYIETKLDNHHYPKILVFRDSFTTALIQYLSASFSKAVYIWGNKIDYPLIEQEQPNIVIYEILERRSGALLNSGM